MLQKIRLRSAKTPKSELSIIIARMTNSGNVKERQLGIKAATGLRNGQDPQMIAGDILREVGDRPFQRRYYRRADQTEYLWPARKVEAKPYYDEMDRWDAALITRNFRVGTGQSEKFAWIGKHRDKASAQRMRDRVKEITMTADGRPVNVRARVVAEPKGGHSVWIRATEVPRVNPYGRRRQMGNISANNRILRQLRRRRNGK